MKEIPQNITKREKFVIVLVIFLIQMVKPWEYDHQFTKFWEELKTIIKDENDTKSTK